jgi:hypothetical protein
VLGLAVAGLAHDLEQSYRRGLEQHRVRPGEATVPSGSEGQGHRPVSASLVKESLCDPPRVW